LDLSRKRLDFHLLDVAARHAPPEVSVPVGFTTFPGEIWRTPRSWVEQSYSNVIYFNEADMGGHFRVERAAAVRKRSARGSSRFAR
jgi:hypothetical protein